MAAQPTTRQHLHERGHEGRGENHNRESSYNTEHAPYPNEHASAPGPTPNKPTRMSPTTTTYCWSPQRKQDSENTERPGTDPSPPRRDQARVHPTKEGVAMEVTLRVTQKSAPDHPQIWLILAGHLQAQICSHRRHPATLPSAGAASTSPWVGPNGIAAIHIEKRLRPVGPRIRARGGEPPSPRGHCPSARDGGGG
jgi:hypothetical protein